MLFFLLLVFGLALAGDSFVVPIQGGVRIASEGVYDVPTAVNGGAAFAIEGSSFTPAARFYYNAPLIKFAFPANNNNFHCIFSRTTMFYISEEPYLPAYSCFRGHIQLLLATEDFRSPANPMEWIDEVDIQLDEDILTRVFPGTFRFVHENFFRPVHFHFPNPSVAVNGLSVLNAAIARVIPVADI